MRLVDANELKGHFPEDEDWDYPVNTNSRVVEIIDNAPTVDAVEVVRCKDCRWSCLNNCECIRNRLYRHNSISLEGEPYFRKIEPDDFCSWGERREDGKTDNC